MNETLDCTNCCISDFKHSLCDCNGDFCTKYKSIGDENDFMQAVLADRPQGKWIDAEIRHEDGVLPIQVCSECKTFYPLEYTGGGHRFCPNCGCRMKGADDE